MESHAEILASILTGRGHRVILGCSVDGTVTVKTKGVILPARRVSIANSVDVLGLIQLVRVIREEHIDVILVNHGKDFWPAAIAARMTRTKVAIIRHLSTGLKRITCLMINRWFDRVIAVSNDVRERLIRSGLASEKIDIIYNGINLKTFDPGIVDRTAVRIGLGIGADEQVIGFVGTLEPWKGVSVMLGAMKRLAGAYPSLKMVFVGDGSEKRGLEKEAEASAIAERVLFTGARDDVAPLYAAMDICVLPSTEGEAFGMVLIEAMAMKRPVIGTRVGGISEIINHEVNGLLVFPKDPDALAKAIRRYLVNPLFAAGMAEEGRLTVERLFSDDLMCDKYERLLHDLIAGRS
jgi:glycosyltransferase involved in cell wall biosynthesis